MRKYISTLIFMLVLLVMHTGIAQVNLTDGLVFHLPLDDNTLDVSGNNNHGTGQNLMVGVNRFESKMKATHFDGAVVNGLISMGAPLMNSLTNWSMSYWFRVGQNTNGMSLVGQDNSIESGYYTSANRVVVFHPTFGSFSFPIASPSSWNHVVVTGDNTAIRCYLNGVLVRTELGNYTAVSTTHNFNIGGNVVNQSNNSWFRGSIDDVRLYNRAINADEVSALFNANSVEVSVTAINQLSVCAGESITVDFSAIGEVLAGNEYLLELSDINGNFVDNIEIGKLTSDALTGAITGTIPQGVQSSANYRVRVSSTNVMSAGLPSSQSLTIQGVVGDIPDPSVFRFVGESNGRLYYRSLNPANFTTATGICQDNGGHLANIGDINDQKRLYSYMGSASAWIGYRRVSGNFIWYNDFPSGFTFWQPSQPGSLNHAVMRVDNGRWSGLAPSESRDYFLQLEPAGMNSSTCAGSAFQFLPGNVAGATYEWEGPNSFSSSDQSPVLNTSLADGGTYSVTITSNGCVSEPWSMQLTVNPGGDNKATGTTTPFVCSGSTGVAYVIDTDPAFSYSLLDAQTLIQIGATQTGNGDTLFFNSNVLTAMSEFIIRAWNPVTGCIRDMDDIVQIDVWELPAAPSVVGDEICNGGSLTLNATGAGVNEIYNWYSNATLTNLIVSEPDGIFETDSIWLTTNFFVTITDENGCESSATSVAAQVINPLSPEIDLLTGLIVHYTYEGNTLDQSGNNINASIVGSNSSYVDDRFGNETSALNLNGSTYTTSGNPPQVGALTNQVTISMWVKQTPSNWGETTPLLNKWQMNGLFVGLNSYLEASNPTHQNRVRWRVNNGTLVNSNTNVPFNQWHHIVCTYNGAQLRVYQNGVLTGQANHTGTITNTITNLEFGRQANGTSSTFYRGDADDVRLYNRALTPNEITALYNNGSVAFSNSPICEGEDILLTAPSFSGASYNWSGPNGFTSTDQNPSPITNVDSLLNAGVYSVEIERNGCTSLPQPVNVTILPTALITAVENDTLCGPGNALLSAVASHPNATFAWYTQATGGTPIAGQTTNELQLNNVSQTETRYVSAILNGCEGPRVPVSAMYYDEVDPDAITLQGIATICQTDIYNLTLLNAQNNVTYEVIINGTPSGITGIGQGSDLVIPVNGSDFAAGTNAVEVTASTPGCGAVPIAQSLTVDVEAATPATITSSTGTGDICNGASIILTASSGDSYLWSSGEITSTIEVSQAGVYSVTVTSANNCQSESQPFTVQEINVSTPTISASGSTSFCSGGDVVLEAQGGSNFTWSTGQTSATITVSASGVFTVESTSGSCSATSLPIEVTVLALPEITISASAQEVCEGEEVTLTASGAVSYQWSPAVDNGIPFIPAATTTYQVVGEDANGCEGTANIVITVNSLPTITIQASATEICEGEEVTLTASGANSYTWNLGVTNGVAFTPSSSATYEVTGTNNNGCQGIADIALSVNTVPIVAIEASSTEICEGEEVTLTASGANSYTWNHSVTNGVAFTPIATQTYQVTGTINNGCEGTAEILITVNNLPIITIGATATEICEGEEITLTASGANSFTWNQSVTNGVAFTPSTTATYEVSGTTDNGCSDTEEITITVHNLPVTGAIAGNSIVNCNTSEEHYSVPETTSSTYTWMVPDGAIILSGQGTSAIVINFNNSLGEITVVETNANGCEGLTQSLFVDCNLSVHENDAFDFRVFPNPTSDQLTISLNSQYDHEVQLTILDNTGRTVYRGTITNSSTIDVKHYAKGSYTGILNYYSTTNVFKFVKQ